MATSPRPPKRRPRLLWGAFAITVALLTTGATGSARAQTTDEAQVLAVAQRLFEGMRTRDTALLRSVFDSSARLVSVRQGIVRAEPYDGFIRAIASAKAGAVWNERIWEPEIRVDGPIAHLWAKYDFHLNDTFSHCGIDAFQLAKTSAGWKIVEIADTRRTEGCTPPPK